jgi:hypothetical protein
MGLSDDQIDNLLRSAEERLAESVASTNATASKSGGLSKTKGQKASAGQAKQKDPVKDLGGRVGLRVVSDAQMGKNKVNANLNPPRRGSDAEASLLE